MLAAQSRLREQMEREPMDFLKATLPARLDAAREVLADFVGAQPSDLLDHVTSPTALLPPKLAQYELLAQLLEQALHAGVRATPTRSIA